MLTSLKVCSWIPLDFAAEALIELLSSNTNLGTVHLIHPQPSLCRDVFNVISEELALPILPFAEWIKILEDLVGDRWRSEPIDQPASNQLLDAVPALKAIGFYKSAQEREDDLKDAMGVPKLATTKALAASDVLRKGSSAWKIGPEDICMWLEYWRRVGFIP